MTMDVGRNRGATAAAVHCGRSVGEGSRRGINRALNAAGVEAGDPVEKVLP